MTVAEVIGARSPCVRTRVGAVIVTPTNRIVATGYNGAPAGLPSVRTCTEICPRPSSTAPDPLYHDCVSIHAEANALLFCDRREREGGTIYTTSAICWNCAKLVANSGLSRLVMYAPTDDVMHRLPESSVDLLVRSGVVVHQLGKD